MINIDSLYYKAELTIRKVNIRGEYEDIVVLKTSEKFNSISLIKTDNNIYKIGDILKTFKDENIYWLELLSCSVNLDTKSIKEVLSGQSQDINRLKDENNTLKLKNTILEQEISVTNEALFELIMEVYSE